MTDPLSSLSVAFWVALAVSAILAKPLLATLLSLNSRQTVSAHAPEAHQKKQGTPTMGGIMIVLGTLAAMLVERNRDWAALVLLVGFALIGFVDDFVVPRKFVGKRGLGWKQKIVMQLVVAVVASIVRRHDSVETSGIVLLVLFFSNAYNFSDGLDGLAGTILLGLGGGLLALGFIAGAPLTLLTPVVALLGAVMPFLFLNAPPARVFMGDVGSLPIGAVLGYVVARFAIGFASPLTVFLRPSLMSDVYGWNRLGAWPLIVLSLVMVVELVPVPLQILSVKLRKKKLFPYTPIHHAFEKAGWPETRVVFHFALVQLLLAILAVGIAAGVPRNAGPISRPVVRR